MKRTITVTGQGKASATADYVVLSLSLEVIHKEYELAMEMAGKQLALLQDSLASVGFDKSDIKTTAFRVNTEYESVTDTAGNYQTVFKGYLVSHSIKLAFDFDQAQLAKVLSAIAGSPSEPRLSIAFTVKDQTEIKDDLLKMASDTARRKAQILCQASDVTLGELQSINYSWSDANLYSRTDFNLGERNMVMMKASLDFVPEDIEIEDTVTFVWEIK
ncbi:MAG: SIMPL domain-containing protein [Clostridiaceae bacterium]|nr:SIMPL domain-containing protein [Clostridiaceae bacterium]